jgi:mutator protein MutT
MQQELLVPIFATAILKKGKQVFLLQRSASRKYAPLKWHLMGGKVEVGESFTEALIREAREEIGIIIQEKDLTFKHVFFRRSVQPSLVVMLFECSVWQSEITNIEPEKHIALGWFDLDKLPEDIVVYHKNALICAEQGISFSDQ